MNRPLLTLRRSRRRSSRRGAYTVEFAFCIPVFLLVLFAAFEFTRFTFARHALNYAAYEAARAAITPGSTSDQIRQRAQAVLGNYGLEATNISVSPNPITDQTRFVSVTLRANFSSFFAVTKYLTSRNLVATATLDHENASIFTQ